MSTSLHVLIFISEFPTDCPDLDLKGDDIAILFGTSGTTGKSKAVTATHAQLLACFLLLMGLYRKADCTEPLLHLGRCNHSTGIWVFEFIASGLELVRMPAKARTPELILQTIHQYKVVIINL